MDSIILRAISADGMMLRDIDEQTPEMCLAAVQNNPEAFQFVNKNMLAPSICFASNAVWYLPSDIEAECSEDRECSDVREDPIHDYVPGADLLVRPWCANGNTCVWAKCRFRHERCVGFGDGTCPYLRTDPGSNRPPADGGCVYDHRDPRELAEFIRELDVRSHYDLVALFMGAGLVYIADNSYGMFAMSEYARGVLARSLDRAIKCQFVFDYAIKGNLIVVQFADRY
jgi:hypothetical protein